MLTVEVGNRVRALKPYDGNRDIVGVEGVIIDVMTTSFVVEFDEPIYDDSYLWGYYDDEWARDGYVKWSRLLPYIEDTIDEEADPERFI